MPQDRYLVLPDQNLQPTYPVQGVPLDRQAEMMQELRQLHNEIAQGNLQRDGQMQAWALSGSLSRQDMGVAVGLAKSRVDQIIRNKTLRDDAIKARAMIERLRRHMSEEQVQMVIHQAQIDEQLAPYQQDIGETIDL